LAAGCQVGLAAGCRGVFLAGYPVGFPVGCPEADYRVECLVRAPDWLPILADYRDKPPAACPVKCPDRRPVDCRARRPPTPADSRVSSSLDRPLAWVAAPAARFPELKDR